MTERTASYTSKRSGALEPTGVGRSLAPLLLRLKITQHGVDVLGNIYTRSYMYIVTTLALALYMLFVQTTVVSERGLMSGRSLRLHLPRVATEHRGKPKHRGALTAPHLLLAENGDHENDNEDIGRKINREEEQLLTQTLQRTLAERPGQADCHPGK